jgi:hypothetical protein
MNKTPPTLSPSEIDAAEARVATLARETWRPAEKAGLEIVIADAGGRQKVMRLTRDEKPASKDDVAFVANSLDDLGRIVRALRGSMTLSEQQLKEMEGRCERASPGPWRAFVEGDGGLGGCSVILVSGSDDEPDLYLWLEDELAPPSHFDFVAAARQDIPRFLAALRERDHSSGKRT